jgi:hypothetical protein
MKTILIALLLLSFVPANARSQSPSANSVRVTVENFARAETDNYLALNAKEAGVGKINHRREPASIDNQTVIRLNRDTLYSFGVFDLNAGPVTVTLPNAGKRFMSLQIINEDHHVPFVAYWKRAWRGILRSSIRLTGKSHLKNWRRRQRI